MTRLADLEPMTYVELYNQLGYMATALEVMIAFVVLLVSFLAYIFATWTLDVAFPYLTYHNRRLHNDRILWIEKRHSGKPKSRIERILRTVGLCMMVIGTVSLIALAYLLWLFL